MKYPLGNAKGIDQLVHAHMGHGIIRLSVNRQMKIQNFLCTPGGNSIGVSSIMITGAIEMCGESARKFTAETMGIKPFITES